MITGKELYLFKALLPTGALSSASFIISGENFIFSGENFNFCGTRHLSGATKADIRLSAKSMS